MRALGRLLRALGRKVDRWEAQAHVSTLASADAQVVGSTLRHDMVGDPDEAFYRAQYGYWIERAMDENRLPTDATVLDLGCGQGRLTELVARRVTEGSVHAVDLSPSAVEAACLRAAAEGLSNVTYTSGHIDQFLAGYRGGSVDLVLFTEVSFFHIGWEEDLKAACSLLNPGGLLIFTRRPLLYNVSALVQQRLLHRCDSVMGSRSGQVFPGCGAFTWAVSDEVSAFVHGLGLELVRMVGIGIVSGIAGDPGAALARPSLLDASEREDLMKLELALGPVFPDSGRYILTSARKPDRGSVLASRLASLSYIHQEYEDVRSMSYLASR
jgi:SAM-dependent methyltransferase